MRFSGRLFLATAAVVLALPVAAVAQTYVALNRLTVVPLNATDFEVIEARGEGARGIWCAAADFAQNRLTPQRSGRLYVKTPRGPSLSGVGRKGVVFTIDANQLSVPPSQALSVSARTAGQGLPIHHAYQFCRDYQIEPDDILFRLGRGN